MNRTVMETITKALIRNGIVSEEDKDIYQYGIEQGIMMLVNLITTIVIGFVFGMVLQSVLFMAAYIPLRTFAGGYHARTQFRCYLLSILLIILSLCVMMYVPWTNRYVLIGVVASIVVIIILSPVADHNKPLSQIEVKRYGNKARMILMLELVVVLICAFFRFEQWVQAILTAWVMLSLILIAGWIRPKRAFAE